MYSKRGGGGSKAEMGHVDRKRINDALDKHLERSSPSTSRGLNGKDKDRFSMLAGNGKPPPPEQRPTGILSTYLYVHISYTRRRTYMYIVFHCCQG